MTSLHESDDLIVDRADPILVTGASGFIGRRVVRTLLDYGFTDIRCLVRETSRLGELTASLQNSDHDNIMVGNLLSREDCKRAIEGIRVIYHLAAGRGEKSFPDAVLNSVVTTRNLLEAASVSNSLRRFVNVSSFSVYSNSKIRRRGLLDEGCEFEDRPELRGDAYTYAKVRQDELVLSLCSKFDIPFVMVRPGVVYGPGNKGIHGRVGIKTFGVFLHLGGYNKIPLSYVDNCADAIVLAGIKKGVGGEVFNVVDDELPTSKTFLKLYKNKVSRFRSIYVPYRSFFLFCYAWELYSKWSERQLPPLFNRRMCATYWKGNRYSNEKLKRLLGWKPKVPFQEAIVQYCEYQKAVGIK